MDDKHEQNNLEESFAEVLQTLPPVIHDYITQGKYTIVAKSLMAKYGLRIDQGGVLEGEILLLLMGVDTPDEFTQALIEKAKIDERSVGGIIQDINDQIFVPLRKEEEAQSRSGGVLQTASSTEIVKPTASSSSPGRSAPPHLSTAPVAPLPPKTVMPSTPARPFSVGGPLPSEQRERISNIAPRSSAPPPANLPGAMPPAPPPPPKPVVRPPITSYSTDPYREPIDEPGE